MPHDWCEQRHLCRAKINLFFTMKKHIASLLLLLVFVCSARAQQGSIVSDIELLNTNGKMATIPYFRSRNLLIFYVDPDRIGQNDIFIQELRSSEKMSNKELYGLTILNAKDAPNVPERLVYKIAQKRSELSGSQFFVDSQRNLSSAWQLGDCNDQSTILIVSESGELRFMSKGKITDEEKAEFYRVVEGL